MIEIVKNPSGKGWVLAAETTVAAPLEEVFEFFSNAANLERMTPAQLNFSIVSEREAMREGLLIHYRLKLRGVPMKWTSRIAVWEPPHRFVDEQVKGPYRRWHHEHTFESTADGVCCRDRVEYQVPGGALIHWLLVRSDLLRIFSFRQDVLAREFGVTK